MTRTPIEGWESEESLNYLELQTYHGNIRQVSIAIAFENAISRIDRVRGNVFSKWGNPAYQLKVDDVFYEILRQELGIVGIENSKESAINAYVNTLDELDEKRGGTYSRGSRCASVYQLMNDPDFIKIFTSFL